MGEIEHHMGFRRRDTKIIYTEVKNSENNVGVVTGDGLPSCDEGGGEAEDGAFEVGIGFSSVENRQVLALGMSRGIVNLTGYYRRILYHWMSKYPRHDYSKRIEM